MPENLRRVKRLDCRGEDLQKMRQIVIPDGDQPAFDLGEPASGTVPASYFQARGKRGLRPSLAHAKFANGGADNVISFTLSIHATGISRFETAGAPDLGRFRSNPEGSCSRSKKRDIALFSFSAFFNLIW
jgi:hypothetical protein